MQLSELLARAQESYRTNFESRVWFERALFLSWYCESASCKFCYMSTLNAKRTAVRSAASVIAESIICREMGWPIGFLSAGKNSWDAALIDLIKTINLITNKKQWLNIGPIDDRRLSEISNEIEGVCGAVETVNTKVHKFVCPDKPLKPILDMLEYADKLGLKKSVTIIIGLGETLNDIPKLFRLIENYNLDRIIIYRLIPHKGTVFSSTPPLEYYLRWIAETRIRFPRIEIVAGTWHKCVEEIEDLLNAGANSVSKFPVIRYYNTEKARVMQEGMKASGRKVIGRFSGKLPESLQKPDKLVSDIEFDDKQLQQKVYSKLLSYVQRMQKNR